MRTRFVIAVGIGAGLALGGAALAQQPVPPADYGPPITNEQAKAVAAAAFAEAKKNNWRMAFTIVGHSDVPASVPSDALRVTVRSSM